MQISKPQIIKLRDALIDALTLGQMNDVVYLLGEDPQSITLPRNKEDMYREIVDWYNKQDRVNDLIVESRTKNPKNPLLLSFAQEVGLESAFLPVAADKEAIEKIIHEGIEKIIPDDLADRAHGFLSLAATAQRRVCLMSDVRGARATGFLIGPSAVITTNHAVQEYFTQPEKAGSMRFTFDFDMDGRGRVYEPAPNWLIDNSPYDPADLDAMAAPADASTDRLDYAIVRLFGRPGYEMVNGAPRGWFVLPKHDHDFINHRGILLYHYSQGRPLQLSIDTDSFMDANRNGTRIWYRSNTGAGSSGSPCFDMEWHPVAMHQGHNVIFGKLAKRAVPLVAVRRLLEERGKLAELEA